MMLDVNAELSGDVSGEFTGYDSDVNRALMEGYLQRWEIPYDEQGVQSLLQHLEGYACGFPPPRRRLSGIPSSRVPGP